MSFNSSNKSVVPAHMLVGGAGFIGSVLGQEFLDRGFRVVAIDNDISGRVKTEHSLKRNPNYRIIEADVSDRRMQEELKAELNGESVYLWHLAANSDIQMGADNPDLDSEFTLGSTLGVINLMKSLNVAKIFFASTSAVYGNLVDSKPSQEDDVCNPISFYGAMKLASEHLLSIEASRAKTPFTIFLLGNYKNEANVLKIKNCFNSHNLDDANANWKYIGRAHD
jgi:UDP-glucose 4-epimerase